MTEIKVTLFTDPKITKNIGSALLEFSTGETMTAIPRYESDLAYEISKCIRNVIGKHPRHEVFQKLE